MDATAPTPSAREVNRFIPLTRQAVVADLCHDPANADGRNTFALLALRQQQHRGRAYRQLAERMRQNYLPFSPDRDTVRVLQFSPEERQAMEDALAEDVVHLLQRANYRQLTNQELNDILNDDNPYSLRISVDLREYDEMKVFVRGETYKTHSVRRPETAYLLKSHFKVRVYRRLFLFLKLKPDKKVAEALMAQEGLSAKAAQRRVRKARKGLPDGVSSDHFYLKVFKNLPEPDVEILFPLRKVDFRPFDKIKFMATAGGGTAFGIFSTTGKVLAATNPFTAVGALLGFIGLVARQVTKFFNQRTQYMVELSQKLFFHNLANNRAALALLLDRAEEEDVKEELITLYFNAGESFPEAELPARKRAIEDRITHRYGVPVDFEMEDALARLVADGVVTRHEGRIQVMSVAEAAAHYGMLLERDDRDDAARICEPVAADEAAIVAMTQEA